MGTVGILIIVIAGALLMWFITAFNSFVRLKNHVAEAWADIDVQLKRRYDLIPNIIETVKGYAAHEQDTFSKIVEARNAAMQAEVSGDVVATAQAESFLSGTLKSLFALSEAYPDLKANANFLELQRELSDTEDKIQSSRRYYNATVRDYMIKRESFPSSIIAKMFGFGARDLYDLDESPAERENIKVSF